MSRGVDAAASISRQCFTSVNIITEDMRAGELMGPRTGDGGAAG